MAKKKISVTIDEELLELANDSGTPVSTLVNAALAEHLDRLARRAALGARRHARTLGFAARADRRA